MTACREQRTDPLSDSALLAERIAAIGSEKLAEDIVLLLGSDQYATLETWHAPDLVRARCRIAVAERPGAPLPAGGHETIAMAPVDVSSSEVRRRVAAGEPFDDLVTPSVAALIRAEGLYR